MNMPNMPTSSTPNESLPKLTATDIVDQAKIRVKPSDQPPVRVYNGYSQRQLGSAESDGKMDRQAGTNVTGSASDDAYLYM